ncbi:MAG: nucleotide sugar dehydrogenase [Rickettsiales bacterium]|nr:nucleotide sugar dehydrogenase [Rickettsiales bacterium]
MSSRTIAVVGLGYVGLPLTVALAKKHAKVIGFDINRARVDELKQGIDHTGEIEKSALQQPSLHFTAAAEDMKEATIYIVTVPTPIDDNRQPDLTAMTRASETIGKLLKRGDIVVYESTVYPGVTEDVCGRVLAKVSGLTQGKDFKLGYSPERINPGDKVHTVEKIVKVVSAEDTQTLDILAELYGSFIEAGVHRASSIKVAEAAKVIENTQRDLNIALINELAIIFDRLGISTNDVLEAAKTKWNFIPFSPGLVGGHCIGVDPYYLTALSERLGYHPQVILAGRRINDNMGVFIAQKTIKLLALAHKTIGQARVAILGVTFKENVRDVRNSRVPDIVNELASFGINALVHDPLVDAKEVKDHYGITVIGDDELHDLDALILAVPHLYYLSGAVQDIIKSMKDGVVVDVKTVLDPKLCKHLHYWSL